MKSFLNTSLRLTGIEEFVVLNDFLTWVQIIEKY
jgi:hypothetical protein